MRYVDWPCTVGRLVGPFDIVVCVCVVVLMHAKEPMICHMTATESTADASTTTTPVSP